MAPARVKAPDSRAGAGRAVALRQQRAVAGRPLCVLQQDPTTPLFVNLVVCPKQRDSSPFSARRPPVGRHSPLDALEFSSTWLLRRLSYEQKVLTPAPGTTRLSRSTVILLSP
jgi:hypothetical protein